MVTSSERAYTPQEIALMVRVSTATILRAIRQGELKTFEVGGRYRVSTAALDEYLTPEVTKALGI